MMTSSRARSSTNPAILSGPTPKRRDWRKLQPIKMTRAEKAMAFAERHLVVPEGKLVGKPIRLAGFQEDFFYAVLDNPVHTRRAILSMARKNAKTATIAILVLVFLVGPEAVQNARLSSGALALQQASEVYNYAEKMAMLSPTLAGVVRAVPSGKRLIGLPMNTEYKAMAAEGKTAHGGSPLVAILDEAGQVQGPYNAFFEAITTSQGAYEKPLEIWISTQARTDGDLFNRLIDDAEAAKDAATVCHVYRAPEDCELDDELAWQAANPALDLFKSRQELVDGAAKAARLPEAENTFRWLHLNQRTNPFSPFVARNVWQANGDAVDDDAFRYGEVYGGLDLSQTTDLTAFVLVARWQDRWHVRSLFFMAKGLIAERAKADRVPYDVWHKQGLIVGTPGKVVALDWVAAKIAEATDGVAVKAIAFDRWRMPLLQTELDRLGLALPMEEYGQGFASMSPAVAALEEALLQERMNHGGHPVLNMCAGNAVTISDPAGNRKLDKARSTGRIDGVVALAMAMGVAAMQQKQEPAAESGIIFL
jgi:phage terminase large subunit-like protein